MGKTPFEFVVYSLEKEKYNLLEISGRGRINQSQFYVDDLVKISGLVKVAGIKNIQYVVGADDNGREYKSHKPNKTKTDVLESIIENAERFMDENKKKIDYIELLTECDLKGTVELIYHRKRNSVSK